MEATILELPEVETATAPDLAELRAKHDEAAIKHAVLAAQVYVIETELERLLETVRIVWRNQHSDLLRDEALAALAASQTDSALREAVIDKFAQTGEKQVDKNLGLSVRVNRKLSVVDRSAARSWAFENAPVCLDVNEKQLISILGNCKEYPTWIQINESVSAVIGSVKEEK